MRKDQGHHRPKNTAMRSIIATLALTAGLTIGGCGSSSTSSRAPGGSPAGASASTPTQTVPAKSGPVTSTTTWSATPAGGRGRLGAHCTAAGLSVVLLGQQGATGHGELGFALRNASSRDCHTVGYPGVLFLGRSGQPLPTSSTRTARDFVGPAPASAITLAPGMSASFRLVVTHGINSSAGCTTAYGLQVIAPDDTSTLRASIPGGAYECGTTTVSPLQPGDSAYR